LWATKESLGWRTIDFRVRRLTDRGDYADFHALRHTFITNMIKSGINPKTAQSLARHSTIDLTMNLYTKLTISDQAAAITALPALKSQNNQGICVRSCLLIHPSSQQIEA